jgi:multidrug efflux pump subunit AcrB
MVCALVALLSGCGRFVASSPPAVRITVAYPGARPSVVEDVICVPILQQLRGIEGDCTITCVSGAGRAEIYVQARQAIDADLLLVLVNNRVAMAMPVLPDAVRSNGVGVGGGFAVPLPATVHEIEFPEVNIDRNKAARLGLSLSTISDAVSRQLGPDEPGPDSVARLEKLTIKAADGKSYHLRDFATIKIVREPNIRILCDPPNGRAGT